MATGDHETELAGADAPPAAGRPARTYSVPSIILRVGIIAIVAFLLARQIDIASLCREFDVSLLWAIALFQLPMIAGHLWYARRHAIFVRDPPIPLLAAFEAVILSSALNIVIPGRVSEFVKATYLRSRLGIPLAHGLSAVVIERLFDIVFVGAIAATGIAGELNVNGALVIAVPLCGIVALFLLRPAAAFLTRRLAGHRNRLASFVDRQCKFVIVILKRGLVARAALLTAGSWLAHLAAIGLFFHVLPVRNLALPDIALVFGAIVLAGAIPALPAGIGVFEAAVVYVLQSRGIAFNQALAYAIALHIAELLPAAILGPLVMFHRSMGIGQLARDAAAEIGFKRRD